MESFILKSSSSEEHDRGKLRLAVKELKLFGSIGILLLMLPCVVVVFLLMLLC